MISLLADIPQLGATTILVMAPKLQEDGIGTGTKGGTSNVHLYSLFLSSLRVPK